MAEYANPAKRPGREPGDVVCGFKSHLGYCKKRSSGVPAARLSRKEEGRVQFPGGPLRQQATFAQVACCHFVEIGSRTARPPSSKEASCLDFENALLV